MNKLEMAQRFAEIMLKTGLQGHWDLGDDCYHGIAQDAWMLADAIQEEADKRIDKSLPDVFSMDWQPDWSQASDNLIYFAVDENGDGWFFNKEPHIENDNCWYCGDDSKEIDFHDYQGNWQDSLRKRPE